MSRQILHAVSGLILLASIGGCGAMKGPSPETGATVATGTGRGQDRVAAGPLGRAARVRADRRRSDVRLGLCHRPGSRLSDVLQPADHPGPAGGAGRRREGGRQPPVARGQDLGPAQRHPDANHRLLAGRPGNRPATRSRDPPTPGSLQPGRERLHRRSPQGAALSVREVRSASRSPGRRRRASPPGGGWACSSPATACAR